MHDMEPNNNKKEKMWNKPIDTSIEAHVEMVEFFRAMALVMGDKQPMTGFELDLKNDEKKHTEYLREKCITCIDYAMDKCWNEVLRFHGSMHQSNNKIIRPPRPICDCPTIAERLRCGNNCKVKKV